MVAIVGQQGSSYSKPLQVSGVQLRHQREIYPILRAPFVPYPMPWKDLAGRQFGGVPSTMSLSYHDDIPGVVSVRSETPLLRSDIPRTNGTLIFFLATSSEVNLHYDGKYTDGRVFIP